MYVGVALYELVIPHAHSLKEKRSVVRGVRELLRGRSISAAEVAANDLHQRARLGAAVVASDRDLVRRMLEDAAEAIDAHTGGLLSGQQIEVLPFDPEVRLESSIEPVFEESDFDE